MRFLGIGESNDLAAMYHGLLLRGHEVKVFVEDEACRDVYAGMLDFVPDWRAELGSNRSAWPTAPGRCPRIFPVVNSSAPDWRWRW